MMNLDELAPLAVRGDLILESLPNSLYQAYFELNGERHPLVDNGTPIRAFSVGKMYEVLGRYAFRRVLIRQSSPYDEMVGQPGREANTLEVPVNWTSNLFGQ